MATNTFNTVIPPPPLNDKFVDKNDYATPQLADWLLLDLLPRVQSASQAKVPTKGNNLAISVPVTALVPVASLGAYRVSWYLQVTKVDATALSATFTAHGTSFTHSINQGGAAMNGNTLTTAQSGSVIVNADAGSVISFDIALVLGTGDGQFSYVAVAEFLE